MGQLWEYIKIALMNIKSNKGRSVLTMLGIIIGISSVIMLISIGNGIKGQINQELESMAGGQVYLYVNSKTNEGDYLSFTEDDFELVKEKVPHVIGASPSWNWWGATVTTRKGEFSTVLQGGNEYQEYSSQEPFLYGSYYTKSDCDANRDVCVITEYGAKQLFGTADVVGVPIELTLYNVTRELTIVGVRKDSDSMMLNMLNGQQIYIDVPLQTFSNFGFYLGDFDSMYIYGESSAYSSQMAKDAVRLLEAKYNVRGENLIQVQDFNDNMDQIGSILNYITIFVAFVAAISLLVGGIGVMNIMLVSVTERTREIGIRKALGARSSSIMLQFLSESAIITLVGGLIGILLGIGGAMAVCGAIGFRSSVDPGIILSATLFSSGVGLFFGIYPARKAAKLSPIEALRFMS